ncbi:hypothetical protein pb186bvf_005010 [Paramecium bursaria]
MIYSFLKENDELLRYPFRFELLVQNEEIVEIQILFKVLLSNPKMKILITYQFINTLIILFISGQDSQKRDINLQIFLQVILIKLINSNQFCDLTDLVQQRCNRSIKKEFPELIDFAQAMCTGNQRIQKFQLLNTSLILFFCQSIRITQIFHLSYIQESRSGSNFKEL